MLVSAEEGKIKPPPPKKKAITRMETNKNSIKKNKVAFNANKTAN